MTTSINTSYSAPAYMITEETKKRITGESEGNSIHSSDAADSATVNISHDGIAKYKESLLQMATSGLQHNVDGKGIIFTDFNTLIGSRMPSIYGEKDDNGEYRRNYFTAEETRQNMMKVYEDLRSEITKGYADGTRKTFVEDKSSEKGYRQLTMEEELDALKKAFSVFKERYSQNNSKEVLGILKNHAQKINTLSNGRAKIASEFLNLPE